MNAGRWRRRSFGFSTHSFSNSSQVARYTKSVQEGKGTELSNRSGKSREEEAEEKVVWIYQKCFTTYPKVARCARSVKGEKGRKFTYSTENKTIWGARALEKK